MNFSICFLCLLFFYETQFWREVYKTGGCFTVQSRCGKSSQVQECTVFKVLTKIIRNLEKHKLFLKRDIEFWKMFCFESHWLLVSWYFVGEKTEQSKLDTVEGFGSWTYNTHTCYIVYSISTVISHNSIRCNK